MEVELPGGRERKTRAMNATSGPVTVRPAGNVSGRGRTNCTFETGASPGRVPIGRGAQGLPRDSGTLLTTRNELEEDNTALSFGATAGLSRCRYNGLLFLL